MLRRIAKETLGWFLRRLYFRVFPMCGACVVLMFHRILPANEITRWNRGLTMSTENFAELVEELRRDFTAVDLYDWIRRPLENRQAFAVTFDDGWRDNVDHAFSILTRNETPATLFVTAGMIGTNRQFWFERLSTIVQQGDPTAVRGFFSSVLGDAGVLPTEPLRLYNTVAYRMKPLHAHRIDAILDQAEAQLGTPISTDRVVVDWHELRRLSQGGWSIGSHGMDHAILVPLSEDEKRFELSASAKLLEGQAINYVPVMCFPNGTYDQQTIDLCLECGYEAMITASLQACGTGEGGLIISRIPVNDTVTLNGLFVNIFRAKWQSKLLTLKDVISFRPDAQPRRAARNSDISVTVAGRPSPTPSSKFDAPGPGPDG